MNRIELLFAVAFFAAGCADKPCSGTVRSVRHCEEDTYIWLLPMQMDKMTYFIPMTGVVPEHWHLHVVDKNGCNCDMESSRAVSIGQSVSGFSYRHMKCPVNDPSIKPCEDCPKTKGSAK